MLIDDRAVLYVAFKREEQCVLANLIVDWRVDWAPIGTVTD